MSGRLIGRSGASLINIVMDRTTPLVGPASAERRSHPHEPPVHPAAALAPVDLVGRSRALRDPAFSAPGSRFARSCRRIYPVCALRYGIIRSLVESEACRQGAVRVCEIGIDRGQMLRFMESDAAQRREQSIVAWHGFDIKPQYELLAAAGYDQIGQADATCDLDRLATDYQIVIACHILEHLADPEPALAAMARRLAPGGAIIGGFPVCPRPFDRWREAYIRRHTRRNGHVSVFSTARLRRMAAACGLRVACVTGAFLMRSSGLALEDYRWWCRLNAWWGRLVPDLGNELYFILHKPD